MYVCVCIYIHGGGGVVSYAVCVCGGGGAVSYTVCVEEGV